MLGGGQPIDAAANSSSTCQSRKARVLLANETRSYREAMAEAIRLLRPGVEVTTVEPVELDRSIRQLVPDMVVCSEATDTVKASVPVWVELYPQHGARSFANIGGKREEYDEIQLPNLLSIIDRAEGLAQ